MITFGIANIENMKTRYLFPVLLGLAVCLSACQSPKSEYCTVKGSVKGLKDGTKLELQDDYDHFKVIESVRVKDGAYEFHPCVSAPTHVYLYTSSGKQLKDFFLEPGTIIADVDDTDEEDMAAFVTGTPANELLGKIYAGGNDHADLALIEEVINAEETGILALHLADGHGIPSIRSLDILDRLSPDLAAKPYVSELREVLTRRAKTEPAPEGSESPNYFIDMTYPDVDGNPVSLSSVVNDPANRLVILDFWATWCSPCRESIPALKELYAKYHEKGLEIYSVSEDQSAKNWKAFIAENGLTWINVLDDNAGRSKSKVWYGYALHGIPTTLLLDGKTGAILFRGKLGDMETMIAERLK
jgi:thiol-disulfide isomerase/thioredoxin